MILFLYDGCSQLIFQCCEGEMVLLSVGEITTLKIHTRLCHSLLIFEHFVILS